MATIQNRLLEVKEGEYTERKENRCEKHTSVNLLDQRIHLAMVN